MILHRALVVLALVCTVDTAARAQYMTPLQRGNLAVMQSMAVQQQIQSQELMMQNEQLEMQLKQQQIGAAARNIGNGAYEIVHACDPDVVRQPGVHLLARLGLCGERGAEQRRTAPHVRGRIVQQMPVYRDGPKTIFDRAD